MTLLPMSFIVKLISRCNPSDGSSIDISYVKVSNIVGSYSSIKIELSMNLVIRALFPTDESPTNATLYRVSRF